MEVSIKINCATEDEFARLAAALATLQRPAAPTFKGSWEQLDKGGNVVTAGEKRDGVTVVYRREVASGEAGEIVATQTGDAVPVSEVTLAADPAPEPEKRGRGRPRKTAEASPPAAAEPAKEPATEPEYVDKPTTADPQSVVQVAPADLVVEPPVQQASEPPGDDVPTEEEITAYLAKCRELNGKFLSTGGPAEELIAVYNRFPHKDNPELKPSTASTVHPSCLAKLVAAVDACVNG